MDIILTPLMLASVPVVIGIVSALKAAFLPSRFAPLVSLVLGLGVAFLIGGFSGLAVLGGLVIGLSASGAYSQVKTTFTK